MFDLHTAEKQKQVLVTDLVTLLVITIFIGVFAFYQKFTLVKTELETVVDDFQIEVIETTVFEIPTRAEVRPEYSMPIAIDDDSEEIEDDDIFAIAPSDFNEISDAPPLVPFQGATETVETIPFFAVAEKPEIIGGFKKLYSFLKYPPMARKAGVSGRVILKFVCNENGIPENIKISQEKPKDMGFGLSAINALKKIRLKPGIQRDKPVKVSMSLPINFAIK